MNLQNFIKRGLLDAVGRQPDFWIILNAAGWAEKGVLTEEDLGDIQAALDAKNAPTVMPGQDAEDADAEDPETERGEDALEDQEPVGAQETESTKSE